MKRLTAIASKKAIVLVLGASVTACSGGFIDRADKVLTMRAESNYSNHLKPRVEAGHWRATVAFRKASSRYAPGGHAHVGEFVRRVAPNSSEYVHVSVPGGATPVAKSVAAKRAKRLVRSLRKHGAEKVRVTFDGDAADAAVLSFHRDRNVATSCPEWRKTVEGRRIDSRGWKFGCMTAGALGASTYARDHSRPAHLGKSNGEEAAIVAKADREGALDPGQDSSGGEETSGGE